MRRGHGPGARPQLRGARVGPRPRWGLAAVGIYLLAGFFLAPIIIRSQVLKHLPVALDRPVTLETVRLNPLTLVLELEDFAIQDPDGTGFISLDGLRVDLQASSLFRPGFTFKEIILDGPAIEVKREPDGTLNFADLLAKGAKEEADAPAEEGEGEIPAVRVGRFVVESGSFSVEDRSPRTHYRKEISSISFTAEDIRTDSEEAGRFNIFGQSGDAESFRLSGQIVPNPVEIQGVLIVEALNLPRFMPYVEHLLNGKVDRGTLSVKLAYDIRPGGDNPVMRIYDGFIDLDEFSLLTHDATDPVINWTRFAVANATVDLLEETVEIEEVTLDGAGLLAHRHADGTLNLATAYVGAASEEDEDTVADNEGVTGDSPLPGDWVVTVGRIGLANTRLAFLDDTLAEPAGLSLDIPEVELTGFTSAGNAPYAVRVSLANEAGGTGSIEGEGELLPLGGSYAFDLKQWNLTPLDPFLSEFTGVDLLEGSLGLKGTAVFSQEENGLTGELALDQVQLLNPTLQLVLQDQAVPDGEAGTAEEAEPVEPAEEALPSETDEPVIADTADAVIPSPFSVFIQTFSIVDGAVTFKDLQQDPDVVFSATDINSQIEGLSSDLSARPTFSLDAQLMEVTPLSAEGQLNLLATEPYADVQVDLKGLTMNPFGPYFSRYVGYNLERGLLNLDLHYVLENSELDASNVVVFNQLTLGSKTDSPDATGLPVPLAISLLKDPAGDIKVDLPIQGRLDDPKFRVSRVVMRALSTLIVKAASSPFNLLAGLVNVNAENLDRIPFAPGTSDLGSAAQSQLDALAEAMKQRPGIGLDVMAGIDPSVEIPALKKRILKDEIVSKVELEEGEALSEAEAYQARLGKAYRSRKALSFLSRDLPPVPEMEAFLMERIDIEPDDLNQLAVKRKQAVRNYLVTQDDIDPDRVLIKTEASLEETDSGLSEVHLSIR